MLEIFLTSVFVLLTLLEVYATFLILEKQILTLIYLSLLFETERKFFLLGHKESLNIKICISF